MTRTSGSWSRSARTSRGPSSPWSRITSTDWSASCSTWSAISTRPRTSARRPSSEFTRRAKGYRPRAKFSTWLFTIANNLALNHLRNKGRSANVALGGATGSQSVPSFGKQLEGREGTPSAQMRKAELSDVVREALGVLNEDQKMAVLLNKFEEMSYAEIAEIMGRSPAAVKSLLARARTQLREQLEPYLLTGNLGH